MRPLIRYGPESRFRSKFGTCLPGRCVPEKNARISTEFVVRSLAGRTHKLRYLGVGDGIGGVGKGTLFFHFTGGAEQPRECNSGERTADADALHSRFLQLFQRPGRPP